MGTGVGDQLLPLAQTQRAGLVNMPVGSTGFGLGFGATAGTHINQGETTPGTPAKTDGGTGLGQRRFDDQRLLGNANFIDELAFGSEQIAASIGANADQFFVDGDSSSATYSHAVESQLNASLTNPFQHEAITKVIRQESFESEVGDEGTFINGGSIVGIPSPSAAAA